MAKEISLPTDWTGKEPTTNEVSLRKGLRVSPGIVLLAVLVATAAAYYNSFGNSFQLDDSHVLIDNPWIRSLKNIPHFFVDPLTFSTLRANTDYRPVLQATYALNYAISGYNPWSWHALSLLLHVSVAVSLFFLGRTLFGRGRITDIPWFSESDGDLISFGAAILFTVHPVNTGIANYMSARSSLLVAAFILPATVLYLRAMHKQRIATAMLLPACLYLLALFTKVEAVSFFGVLYVAELLLAPNNNSHSRQQKRNGERVAARKASLLGAFLPTSSGWRRLLPFALLTAVYFGIRLALLSRISVAWGVASVNRTTYFLTQFRAWWYYVGQLLAPVNLVSDYGAYPESHSLFDPRFLYALAGWALVAGLLVYAIRKAPVLAFLGLAYFIELSPPSSFMPLTEMVNEHRPYLPTAGLFLLGMVGLFLVIRKLVQRPQLVFAVVVLLLALPLAALTHARNKVWKDDLTFWQDTVEKDPESARAQMNYGLALMERAQYTEAEQRFREALRLAPFWDRARINLGIDLAAQGRFQEAQPQYDEAVRLTPNSPDGYYWRGLFHSKQGDLAGAITDFQKAVALAHTPARELQALADVLIRAGRLPEAREAIDRGAAFDPEMFRPLRTRLAQPNTATG